jgi:pimeloyl-ACP methyl ester carboxylesterase
MMFTLPRLLALVALIAVLLYAAALWWVYLQQEKLLFAPTPLASGHQFSLDGDVHELTVPVPGAALSVLHLRLAKPKGVVFFLHGNAGNLDTWFVNTALYRELNYDLVMMDYRGYGKSTGRIQSEAQLHADVDAVWAFVAHRYQGVVRVALGRSLGTALAARWAVKHQPDLTVLVSPYCSMTDLAKEHFPLVPSRLLRYPLTTCDYMAQLHKPALLIHGDKDTLISPQHSERIQARAAQAQLIRIEQAAHNDVHQFDIYTQAVRESLGTLQRAGDQLVTKSHPY